MLEFHRHGNAILLSDRFFVDLVAYRIKNCLQGSPVGGQEE